MGALQAAVEKGSYDLVSSSAYHTVEPGKYATWTRRKAAWKVILWAYVHELSCHSNPILSTVKYGHTS